MIAAFAQEPPDIHVRWMIRRDMAPVIEIENDSFPFPWPEEEFLNHLRQRNTIGMVAEQNENLVGYAIYELHRRHLHLLNIAVRQGERRSGVGTVILEKLKGKLSPNYRRQIKTMVSESNFEALVFFRAVGFVTDGIERSPYEENDEDGYKMSFDPFKVSGLEMPSRFQQNGGV